MTKRASYGIIETIGGFVMARSYRHIKQYEKEILKLKEQGLTHKEIGEQLGFTQKQVKKFIERYHRKERKLAAGIEIKPKGRPRKDGTELPPSVMSLCGIFSRLQKGSETGSKVSSYLPSQGQIQHQ